MKRENGKSYILKKEINQMLTKGQMKTRQHHCQNTNNDEKTNKSLQSFGQNWAEPNFYLKVSLMQKSFNA